MPLFLCPMTASFIIFIFDNYSHRSGFDLILVFLFKAFVLRCSLVVATLLHETFHLTAAATTCHQPFKSVFSRKNLMGNVEFGIWLKALCPLVQWPYAASSAHVKLPFSPSTDSHAWIRLAGPSASLLLAVACSASAWLLGYTDVVATAAAGTWMIAIGGIASDVLTATTDTTKFRCGNFGMLVICMMDRCVTEPR